MDLPLATNVRLCWFKSGCMLIFSEVRVTYGWVFLAPAHTQPGSPICYDLAVDAEKAAWQQPVEPFTISERGKAAAALETVKEVCLDAS